LGWEAYYQHTNETKYDSTLAGEGFRYGAENSVMMGFTVECCAAPSSRISTEERLTPYQSTAPRKRVATTETGETGRKSTSPPLPSQTGPTGVPPRGERRYLANQIITAFVAGTSPQAIAQIAQRYNLTQLETQNFPLIGTALYRWQLNGGRALAAVIGALEQEPVVASAQPNYVFTLQQDAKNATAPAAGDPAQYVLAKMQVLDAQKLATGKNVAVAVIDSEVDQTNKELAGSIAKSFDALGGNDAPHQHGTGMAGAIAAHSRLLGIAPGAQLYAARSFEGSDSAKGTSFSVYKSLEWSADNGVRLINMSFAGPNDPGMHRFLDAAYGKDIILVAAAGNAGPKAPPLYPGSDTDVIAVTATDSNDAVFKMANHGDYIAIAAPGVDIIAAAPGGSYQFTSGTSIAAAHVSGVVALLLEKNPALKPKDVRDILMKSATPLGPKDRRAEVGAGLSNAYQAVKALEGGNAGGGQAKP
jgi:subtilisin family serine protease